MYFGRSDWTLRKRRRQTPLRHAHYWKNCYRGAKLRACIDTYIMHVYKQYAHGDLTPLCLFSPPTPIQNSCVPIYIHNIIIYLGCTVAARRQCAIKENK